MAASDVWTALAALDWVRGYLERQGSERPRLEAEHLLSHATGLTRTEVYAHFDRPLSQPERDVLRDAVVRRAAGEPLQYIFGRAPFRYLEVEVGPGVLIPRPETELLVDAVLPAIDAAIAARGEALVVDVGTGSGAVAIAIATERPAARVVATDLSPDALEWARRNVEAHGVGDRVTLVSGDLLEPLPAELVGRVDVVVSNPPYIPTDDLAALPREVAEFEPREALDGGDDGLALFDRLAPAAVTVLAPGGTFAAELDEKRTSTAAQKCVEWYQGCAVVEDLVGRERIVVATKDS